MAPTTDDTTIEAPLEPGMTFQAIAAKHPFVICSKGRRDKADEDAPPDVDHWRWASASDDLVEATRRATQLVTAPYLEAAACVMEIGGTEGIPTFTLRVEVTRKAVQS